MNDSNLIYAKFYLSDKMTVKGYFDPKSEATSFLPIFDANNKPVGLIPLSVITFVEYLDIAE